MENLSLENLGQVIKNKRGTRGIREIAKEIGISPSTLSRVESGKHPDLETFTQICRWLEVEPGEVLGYTLKENIHSSAQKSSPFENITTSHFRAPKVMQPETATYLTSLILHLNGIMDNGD